VRRHHLRRLRNAFRDALKAKNMDEDGRLLEDISERNPKGFPMLKGSLSLYLTSTVLRSKYTDLQSECSKIVTSLLSFGLGSQSTGGRTTKVKRGTTSSGAKTEKKKTGIGRVALGR